MRTKSKERTEKMEGSLKIANETKKIKTNNGELHNTKREQMKHGRWREWRKQRQDRGKSPEKKNTDYKEQGEIKNQSKWREQIEKKRTKNNQNTGKMAKEKKNRIELQTGRNNKNRKNKKI